MTWERELAYNQSSMKAQYCNWHLDFLTSSLREVEDKYVYVGIVVSTL